MECADPQKNPSELGIKTGFFDEAASDVSRFAGKPLTFFLALLTVLVWAALGPVFGYSEVWQLVINTGTTIITFLLLFVVQNTQNRDTMALQLKLDAIIYVLTGCDNELIKAEDLTVKELEQMVAEFKKKAEASSPEQRSQRMSALNEGSSQKRKLKKRPPLRARAKQGRTHAHHGGP